MHTINTNDLLTALQLLEDEIRHLNWWEQDSPNAQALSSTQPFCVDTLTFTQWLQWIYIPKMTALINNNKSLPSASDLLSIAEEAWKNCEQSTEKLLVIIKMLDNLIFQKPYQHLFTQIITYQ